VLDHVIRRVGARPRDRDEIDRRIIRQLLAREGRIIHSQDEVGGYPQVTPVHCRLEVPATGIDQWLKQLADELE
jgi:hypothetical protein